MKDQDLFDRITIAEFDKTIAGEVESRRAIFLILCSMFIKNIQSYTMNVMINSESSAGKSYICKQVCKIFPKAKWEYRTKITPEAFTYWHSDDPNWNWDGKICYLEDIDQKILDSSVFKVMCSEGSTATIVIKQKSYDMTINGKPVMIITTAATNPNNEVLNRFLILNLDESKEQTKRILQKQAKDFEKGYSEEYDKDVIESLNLLNRVKVKLPEISLLVDLFPTDNLRIRREFSRFITLIAASCALHQHQRECDEYGYYIPAIKDIILAREVFIYILECSSFFGLTHRLKKSYQKCIELGERQEWFTVKDIHQFYPYINERNWYRTLDKLLNLGLLLIDYQTREGTTKKVGCYKPISSKIEITNFKQLSQLSQVIDMSYMSYLSLINKNLKDSGCHGIEVYDICDKSKFVECPKCGLKVDLEDWIAEKKHCIFCDRSLIDKQVAVKEEYIDYTQKMQPEAKEQPLTAFEKGGEKDANNNNQ